jgi:hypothetical protein
VNEWFRVLDKSKHAERRHFESLRLGREAAEQKRAAEREQEKTSGLRDEAAMKIQALLSQHTISRHPSMAH